MKINLVKSRAIELSIDSHFSANKQTISSLEKCMPQADFDKGRAIFFSDSYSRDKRKHYAFGFVLKEQDKSLHVHIEYSVVPIPLPKKSNTLEKMIECISLGAEGNIVEVGATFQYEGDMYESIFELPVVLAEGSSFNEIRGLRVAKSGEGKKLQSVIIDRPDNEDIYHTVGFATESAFSTDLPQTLLKQAESISLTLIRNK